MGEEKKSHQIKKGRKDYKKDFFLQQERRKRGRRRV